MGTSLISSVSHQLASATDQLNTCCDSARLDAEVLLAHVLGQNRSWLYAHGDDTLSAQTIASHNTLIERRVAGEPVAYLTGEQEFWSLPLKVSRDVLIPRSDTELLVDLVLQHLTQKHQTVLELGTGSAAIAIALSVERPALDITATDVSTAALRVASDNVNLHQCSNITLVQSDWFSTLKPQCFDVLVSNPPYIADDDPHLDQADLRSEPQLALTSGPDGMAAIQHIVGNASPYLRSGSTILLEHGYTQAGLVQQLLQQHGYQSIKSYKDHGDNNRVTCAQHP